MKHDSNRVRRLNQQIDVWRKHAPDYIEILENKLASQSNPNTGKQGQFILSARNMTNEEYEEQEAIMYYMEHELGTWTKQYNKVMQMLTERYDLTEDEISEEQIEKVVSLKANYNTLITDLFNIYESAQARYHLDIVEDNLTEESDKIEYLYSLMQNNPEELPIDMEEFMQREKEGNPFL